MDDSLIIELYFARNEQAIEKTQEKYGKLCHSIAYNVLNSHEDAVECVNDAYLGVWNTIPPKKPNNLKAYICKIVRNLSLKKFASMHRQKRSQDMVVSLSELEEILPNEAIAPNVSDQQLGALISKFLHGENEAVRNVFIRKYWFFDSIEDIAKRYSFSKSKVKSMLYHTRLKLKEFLTKEGVEI